MNVSMRVDQARQKGLPTPINQACSLRGMYVRSNGGYPSVADLNASSRNDVLAVEHPNILDQEIFSVSELGGKEKKDD